MMNEFTETYGLRKDVIRRAGSPPTATLSM